MGTDMKQELIGQAISFGVENRMNQTQEECSELVQAICKYRRAKELDKTCLVTPMEALSNITEEIADIEICIAQLKYLLGLEMKVEHEKENKLLRTRGRLNGEIDYI